MPSLHFILNPLAGSGRSAEGFARVEKILKEKGITDRVHATECAGAGHACALEAIAEGAETLVAVGGDGTLNEVASALLASGAKLRFGLLPFGTGNDFARALGIPSEPEAALSRILAGHTRALDAGRVNGRFFLNVAGLGFDVEVLRDTDRYKARFNGMLPYVLGILSALSRLECPCLRISAAELEAPIEEPCAVFLAGNGQYFGGGMYALPQADPFDGLFHVRMVRKVSLLQFLRLIVPFVKGRLPDKHPLIRAFTTRALRVECPDGKGADRGLSIELDGEIVAQTPAQIELLPGAVELLI